MRPIYLSPKKYDEVIVLLYHCHCLIVAYTGHVDPKREAAWRRKLSRVDSAIKGRKR